MFLVLRVSQTVGFLIAWFVFALCILFFNFIFCIVCKRWSRQAVFGSEANVDPWSPFCQSVYSNLSRPHKYKWPSGQSAFATVSEWRLLFLDSVLPFGSKHAGLTNQKKWKESKQMLPQVDPERSGENSGFRICAKVHHRKSFRKVYSTVLDNHGWRDTDSCNCSANPCEYLKLRLIMIAHTGGASSE